jgi:hypothetical protein
MIVVIQCAATKHAGAGRMTSMDGAPVTFVRRGLRLLLIVELLWYREHHVMDDQLVLIRRLQCAQLTAIAARHAYVTGVP